MNHELAAQVLDKIISYPENFDMNAWFSPSGNSLFRRNISCYIGPDPTMVDDCKTTMCIAGWVDFLTSGNVNTVNIVERAASELGISLAIADILFHGPKNRSIEALEIMSKPDSTETDLFHVFGHDRIILGYTEAYYADNPSVSR